MSAAQTLVLEKPAQLLCLLSRCAARLFALVMRRAAFALSASRVLCAGFRLSQARLLRCPLRVLVLLRFVRCARGSGACRCFCFQHFCFVLTGAALAFGFCDGSGARLQQRVWRGVSAFTNASGASPQQRANKALHPTAYSLRFGRSSRRFGFRRRVSLVVRPHARGSSGLIRLIWVK